MADLLFQWISDTDDDGDLSDEAARYATAFWVPNIDEPEGGRQRSGGAVPTLAGGVVVLSQNRAGYADGRGPGRFTLKWGWADPDFIRLSAEDYARHRLVEVRLDHLWRQCEVTSSGLSDRKATVAAGYIDDGGDSYWLAADTAVVCGGSDTFIYATLADGVATPDSGTEVPAGAKQLAAITIADDIVTVTSDPSGAANARRGYITPGGRKTMPEGPHMGLELTIQEVR